MTEDEFNEGWNYIHTWWKTKVNKAQAKQAFNQKFFNRNGPQFIQACKNVCDYYDNLPRNLPKAILTEMQNITTDEPIYAKGCRKCEGGLIHFILIRGDAALPCCGSCNCISGQAYGNKYSDKYIPPFFSGAMANQDIDEYSYGGEVVIVEITPEKAIELGIWDKVIATKDLPVECLKENEVKPTSRLHLTLEQGVFCGIKKAIEYKKELDFEEKVRERIAKGEKPRNIIFKMFRKLDEKAKAKGEERPMADAIKKEIETPNQETKPRVPSDPEEE